eukprot:9426634-Ditylum_brightwellii.AAC.1
MASIGLPIVVLIGAPMMAVWITGFLLLLSMLGVMLVLDDSNIGAIGFISCLTAIGKNLEFLKVIFDLLLFKRILGLVAFWLVTKNSLHIFLIGQSCNCDVETSTVKMTDLFLAAGNIGVEPH